MNINPVRAETAVANAPAASAPVDSVWGRDGFGFDDLLDIVNPLQHIPGVGHLYRAVSGDDIGVLPRIVGGLLFGGVAGGAIATVNAGIEAGTGQDAAEHMVALLTGDQGPPEPATLATAVAAYDGPAKAIAAPLSETPAELAPHAPALARTAGRAAATTAAPIAAAPDVHGFSTRILAELEAQSQGDAPGRIDQLS